MLTEEKYRAWRFTIGILNFLGFYKSTKQLRNVIFPLLFLGFGVFVLLMTLIQFPILEGGVFDIVSNLESFLAFAHMILKVSVGFTKHDKLMKMLDHTAQFWKTDLCPAPVKVKLDKMLITAEKMEKVFFYTLACTVAAIILYPLMEGHLTLGVWYLNDNPVLYRWVQVSEVIIFGVGGLFLCIFDCLFFGTCLKTIVQFKILCSCLMELKFSKVSDQKTLNQYNNKLRLYIQHHDFLIGFLRELQDVYSPAFVVEGVTIAPLISAEMYAILDGNRLDHQMRHMLICFTQTFQLTFYCIAADSVSSEAMTVGDAMYNSDWYTNSFFTIGKPMTLIIQKSQRAMVFTAGGLFEMKSNTVLTVVRVAWSVCTVLRGLKDKK